MHPADHPGPLVFVDDLQRPVLPDADRHHLRRVLRLRPGDPLTLADGAGRWRPARLGADDPEPAGDVLELPAPAPPITVGFALVKGDKPELIVQKLTELGVDHIVPLTAARSVVRWDPAKADRAVERLRAVARAAAMQSHRPRLPTVEGLAELASFAGRVDVAMAERDGRPPALAQPTVLVGPEGGWSDDERSLGLPRVGLGTAVLRSETAAITAGALMTALRAGIVGQMA